jgi:hypothetical protein
MTQQKEARGAGRDGKEWTKPEEDVAQKVATTNHTNKIIHTWCSRDIHRWACLPEQQMSITVYCLPTKENKLTSSVSSVLRSERENLKHYHLEGACFRERKPQII